MSILTVCSANICRSPLAEALLRKSITEAGGTVPRIESAGVQAVDGMTLCSEAALVLSEAFSTHQSAPEHHSRRLTITMIEQAELILVSTAEQRSIVAQMSPTARHRSFTFIEAASFLRILARQSAVLGENAGKKSSLADIAAQMNSLRSSVGPVETAESHHLRLTKGKNEDALNEIDITDGHLGRRRRHKRTLEQIRHTVLEIAEALELLGVRRFVLDEGLQTGRP